MIAVSALLVAAVLGVWAVLNARDGAREGAGAPVLGVQAAAHEATAAAQSAREAAAAPPGDQSGSGEAVTVYVVGSETESERMLAALNDADSIRGQLHLPPLTAVVVLAGSADEARVRRALDDVTAIREALNLSLPEVTLIPLPAP